MRPPLTLPEARSRRARLPVLLAAAAAAGGLLEGFAGIKSVLASPRLRGAQVLQVALLAAHLGTQLRHLLEYAAADERIKKTRRRSHSNPCEPPHNPPPRVLGLPVAPRSHDNETSAWSAK